MHSGLFMVYTVPLGLLLGVVLAVSTPTGASRASRSSRRSSPRRWPSSVAVASVIFFTLVNPEVGYFKDVAWLSLARPGTSALFAVSLSSVWQNLGLTFIIVLAALQAVPDELDRGRDPRRLRPGPALLAHHRAADQPGAAVPGGRAGGARPAGVRTDRDAHRRWSGRGDRDPAVQDRGPAGHPKSGRPGLDVARVVRADRGGRRGAVLHSCPSGCTMATEQDTTASTGTPSDSEVAGGHGDAAGQRWQGADAARCSPTSARTWCSPRCRCSSCSRSTC